MNIVTLSTYPLSKAAHGGQHRIKNIVRFLSSYGHKVQACGISSSPEYVSNKNFIDFPGRDKLIKYISPVSLMEDWAVGQIAANDDKFFKELKSKFEIKPDLLIVEQPWLYDFAERLVGQMRLNKPKIIYGSQNIECELKAAIVSKYLGAAQGVICKEKVLETELRAIKNSSAVICVSPSDEAWIKKENPRTVKVVRNGVENRRHTYEDIKEANEITEGRRFAFYCASGHPPNIEGFYEIFRNGIGSFAPDQRFVIAGGAGHAIKEDKRFDRISGLKDIFLDAGVVSEGRLRGLLATAHLLMLPITSGGGTNLKTAEAIWAGHRIVATSKAMRGFENFIEHESVAMADTSVEFLAQVRAAMRSDPYNINADERMKRLEVLWSETLKPLLELVN